MINVGLSKSVGASETSEVVSKAFKPSSRSRIRVYLQVSSATVTNAVTAKLQHSAGGVWFDVGNQAQVSVTSFDVASASDVNTGTDTLTETSHSLETGDPVVYAAGAAAIGGLTDGETYYAIDTGNNTFQLATSQAAAYAGTAISLTGTGTGTQVFTPAGLEIRMLVEDSSDAAQLPLYDSVRVVVDTGASDAVQFAGIWA